MFQDTIILCTKLYELLAPLGNYPALTGGQLYKEGIRKDIDIVLYSNRQQAGTIDWEFLTPLLKTIDVEVVCTYGFVNKATWRGYNIDFLVPERTFDEDEAAYNAFMETQRHELVKPQDVPFL